MMTLKMRQSLLRNEKEDAAKPNVINSKNTMEERSSSNNNQNPSSNDVRTRSSN
jgi:hypothetical protein